MPVPPLGEDQIIEAIAAGDRCSLEIARRAGMSILELARIVTTPDNLKQLQQVAQLHAIQREMLLGKLKRHALIRLAELTAEVGTASGDEVRACEVMRKACADLLRSGGSNTEKRSSRPGGPGGPRGPGSRRHHRELITPATEAEVLEALERWGKEEEEKEEEVYPRHHDSVKDGGQAPITQITQIAQMNSGGFKSECENGGGTDSDRRESSVELAGTTSNRIDDFGRKAGLRCQWHPPSPPESPPPRRPLHHPRPPPQWEITG